jgi:hypothetical protein
VIDTSSPLCENPGIQPTPDSSTRRAACVSDTSDRVREEVQAAGSRGLGATRFVPEPVPRSAATPHRLKTTRRTQRKVDPPNLARDRVNNSHGGVKKENGSGSRPNHSFHSQNIKRLLQIVGCYGQTHLRFHPVQPSHPEIILVRFAFHRSKRVLDDRLSMPQRLRRKPAPAFPIIQCPLFI